MDDLALSDVVGFVVLAVALYAVLCFIGVM